MAGKMLQKVVKRLSCHVKQACTSTQTRGTQELLPNPAVQHASAHSKGSYMTQFPSLLHPPRDFHLPPCLPDNIEPCRTMITTLPNGVKIASENIPGPAACLGIFVNSGSIYESDESSGATHLLERMAFKSTKSCSRSSVIQAVESIGGNVAASASRDQMGYTYDVLKPHLEDAVKLLIDCVINPLFLANEVQEQLDIIKIEIRDFRNNTQNFLLESLHPAGYSGALAKPLMVADSQLSRLDSSVIERFFLENYCADRMVLAASGVDHEELTRIVEPLLRNVPRGPPIEEPRSVYVGGEFRCPTEIESTNVSVAFEVPGGWRQETDAIFLTVLQTLMGGGGSFSAGGPGKGMHSRLFRRVLNRYAQVQAISAFSSLYNETGIFGIQVTAGPDFISEAVELAAKELLAVAMPGQVTAVELQRAKNSTKSAVLMNLEARMIITEDIGRQILTYGCRKPVDHFLKAIDELTPYSLSKFASKIISSPLTMASCGVVDRVPSYEQVSRYFR